MDRLDFLAERRHETSESTGRHYRRPLLRWPLGLDAAHQTVDGVGRAPQHAEGNAVCGAPADRVRRRYQLGGWKLGGLATQLIGRGAQTRHDDSADETAAPAPAPAFAVDGDAVERGRRAEIHD